MTSRKMKFNRMTNTISIKTQQNDIQYNYTKKEALYIMTFAQIAFS